MTMYSGETQVSHSVRWNAVSDLAGMEVDRAGLHVTNFSVLKGRKYGIWFESSLKKVRAKIKIFPQPLTSYTFEVSNYTDQEG